MNRTILLLVSASAALCPAPGSGLLAETVNAYHIGNSLTDGYVYHANYKKFVQQHRPGTEYKFGAHIIFGSPIEWIWDHGQPHDHDGDGQATTDEEKVGQAAKQTNEFGVNPGRFYTILPTVKMDYLTLQPFDRSAVNDFHHFAAMIGLLKQNPDNLDENGKVKTQVSFFSKWPGRDVEATHPVEGSKEKVIVYKPFDFTGEWFNPDVTHKLPAATDSTEDDYRGGIRGQRIPYSILSTHDFSTDLAEILRDPDSLGKPDPVHGGSGKVEFKVDPIPWGPFGSKKTMPAEHPAAMLAQPVRMAPVGDAMAAFEKALRGEVEALKQSGQSQADAIAAVEAKYDLPNTRIKGDISKLPNQAELAKLTNLGDLNFAEHLYPDGIHLTSAGRYLQQLVIYATMFGENPAGLAPAGLEVDEDFQALAQRIAWEVVTSSPYTDVKP
jgi:hypothetical protein